MSAKCQGEIPFTCLAVIVAPEPRDVWIIEEVPFKVPPVSRAIFATHSVEARTEPSSNLRFFPVGCEVHRSCFADVNPVGTLVSPHKGHHELHFVRASNDADFDFVFLWSCHNDYFYIEQEVRNRTSTLSYSPSCDAENGLFITNKNYIYNSMFYDFRQWWTLADSNR